MIGLNPYLLFDDDYLRFFQLLTDHVSRSLANVHYLESERERAEALAEIDRAKTTFFSNISHEFRTPLTLLLGPISEALDNENIPETEKANLKVAYRNALRMQKLTNNLLDFSRIEAGRMHGSFQKVDLVSITKDLASTFQSAIEKSGMQMIFHAEPVPDDIYVDINMWEKIVLNLLSNAFKYTLQGTITITIAEKNGQLSLKIKDTGIGIPKDELDKIFDRFHRAENIDSRSQEGTGIGLSMVKELVKLHHGTITVTSVEGKGSCFEIVIPTGIGHLPKNKIVSSVQREQISAIPFINDSEESPGENLSEHSTPSANLYKVLLADDNADMRQYVQRILSAKYNVKTATNGKEAFELARQFKPDLILSDIMMPKLNGYGLLAKIRGDKNTRSIPIVFLSAKAGEEARVEGLDSGADDYLTKPFSAKELVARIESAMRRSIDRRTAEKNEEYFRHLADSVPAILWRTDTLGYCNYLNKKWYDLTGQSEQDALGFGWLQATHEDDRQRTSEIFGNALQNRKPFSLLYRLRQRDGNYRWSIDSGTPTFDEEGNFEGFIGSVLEVHEEKTAKDALQQTVKELMISEDRFRLLATSIPQIVWTTNSNGEVEYLSKQWTDITGGQLTEKYIDWVSYLHPDDVDDLVAHWKTCFSNGKEWNSEFRLKNKTGEYRWFLGHTQPLADEKGNIVKWVGAATDIHDLKAQAAVLEQKVFDRTIELNASAMALQQSNADLQQFAHVASHDLREPVRKIKTFANRIEEDEASRLSDKAKTFLLKIQHATNRMSSMIEGVLHYSTVNSLEGEIEPVDLSAVVSDICSDLELLIAEKKAVIHCNNLPVIEAARILIYQLFYNLINNSLKFSRDSVAPEITINGKIYQSGNQEFAEILLSDNGIGFESQSADRIFKTFERLNSKDKYEGTGLGLALCKKIVERHNGTITAEGKPLVGATFIIHLPSKQ